MSREIKFRAWFKVHKRMVYNLGFDQFSFKTIEELEGTEYMPSVYDMDTVKEYDENGDAEGYEGTFHFEIMQFTGLKDKNGKEIYEGDICEVKVKGVKTFNTSIIFEDGCYFTKERCEFLVSNLVNYQSIEVIGNIYENPELLEG